MGLELAAARLGQTIATRAATAWLVGRNKEKARTSSLADLAAAELAKPVQKAKFETLVQSISNTVTEQLEQVLQRCPEDEIEPSLTAVEVALQSIDLSDEAFLADDADPEVLAQRIRRELPRQDLGRFYDIALDQSCRYLVQVIRHLPSFQPRALAEVLSRATVQTAMLDEVLARLPRTSLYAPQGTDNDDEFRDEYLRFIGTHLDRLELLGLTSQEHPPLALSVAYLSLTVSGSSRQKREWFGEPDHRTQSGVRVESALSGRSLVRGEAGSGKTTLLDWLAVTAARGEFVGDLRSFNGKVPFPIRLRAYADSPLPTKPEDFVTGWLAGIMPGGWAHRVLRAGDGLLLIDGVDEVPPSKRHNVRVWLRALANAFPEAKMIVTARPAAADEKWLAELDFSSVVLDPMSPTDVKVFLERWHEAAAAPEEAQRRLLSQLESREHLRSLASSPLLCAMLCALNLSRTSELPQNRMELYAAALAMLLDLRDAERGISRMLTTSEKTVLLRDLAWRLTLGGRSQLPTGKVHEHVARKILSMPNADEDPRAVVTHLLERSGVIREPVPGQVDFVHRTFQEYLAGEEAMQDGQIDTLVAHAHQDSWTQTIVLACGHGQRAQVSELLTELLDRAVREPHRARRLRILAAACLETVRDVAAEVHERIDAIIRDKLIPPRSMKETISLATIGHRILRYLPSSLDELSDAAAAATIRSAALVGSPEAIEKLAGYSQDPRISVQEGLIDAWSMFDPKRYAEDVLSNAPLQNGHAQISDVRLIDHLPLLHHLKSVDIILPSEDEQQDLLFLKTLPQVRFLRATVRGTVDLNELRGTKIRGIHLHGATYFKNVRRTPKNLTGLGLRQSKPWRSLEFLRATQCELLTHLVLSRVAPDCDLSPLLEMKGLLSIGLEDWTELDAIPALRHVQEVQLTSCEPIDLRPLRDTAAKLILYRYDTHIGVDELGPDVRVEWRG